LFFPATILDGRRLSWCSRQVQGWRTVIATYQGGHSRSIRLDRRSSRLPGDTEIQTWRIHRRWRYYEGTLHSPAKSMTFRLAPFSGRLCTVDIDGDSNDVEAVSLTACYALLVRRNLDQIIMVTAGHLSGAGRAHPGRAGRGEQRLSRC
jgi:hypothetical protein